MPATNKKSAKSQTSKKDVKQNIIQRLEEVLGDFRTVLGEKKFNSRIRKVSKLFVHAIPKKQKAGKTASIKKKAAKPRKKKKEM